MNHKKKIILIISVVMLMLAIITGIICWIKQANKTENELLDGTNSRITKLYAELEGKQIFSFSTKLDQNNEMYYAKKDNTAYINTIYQGEESTFLVKDGNSYLLKKNTKKYYTYQNNETDLNKIILQLGEIKDNEYRKGKEKIDNKNYEYEEYEGITEFLIKDIEADSEKEGKTRFYFEDDQLVYIKTIIGEEEEQLTVEILDEVDSHLFEIPSDYQKV